MKIKYLDTVEMKKTRTNKLLSIRFNIGFDGPTFRLCATLHIFETKTKKKNIENPYK